MSLEKFSSTAKALKGRDNNETTKGPLERFEGVNFYDSAGNIATAALNCNSGILNRKPCFPELVWDNLQSTTPIKAIAIVDDIGQMLGVLMRKKGKSAVSYTHLTLPTSDLV